MTDNSMTFSNTLMQLCGEDFLRELTEFMLNRIMEADVTPMMASVVGCARPYAGAGRSWLIVVHA